LSGGYFWSLRVLIWLGVKRYKKKAQAQEERIHFPSPAKTHGSHLKEKVMAGLYRDTPHTLETSAEYRANTEKIRKVPQESSIIQGVTRTSASPRSFDYIQLIWASKCLSFSQNYWNFSTYTLFPALASRKSVTVKPWEARVLAKLVPQLKVRA